MSQGELIQHARRRLALVDDERRLLIDLIAIWEHREQEGGFRPGIRLESTPPQRRITRSGTAPKKSERGSPGSPSVVIDQLLARVGSATKEAIDQEVRTRSTTSSKDIGRLVSSILVNKKKYRKENGLYSRVPAEEQASAVSETIILD